MQQFNILTLLVINPSHDMMTCLSDVRLVRNHAYMNGKWVDGSDFHPVENPATNQPIGYITKLSAEQINIKPLKPRIGRFSLGGSLVQSNELIILCVGINQFWMLKTI